MKQKQKEIIGRLIQVGVMISIILIFILIDIIHTMIITLFIPGDPVLLWWLTFIFYPASLFLIEIGIILFIRWIITGESEIEYSRVWTWIDSITEKITDHIVTEHDHRKLAGH